ncbi:hypothetical protein X777_16187, partial [Ooceraea biroi]
REEVVMGRERGRRNEERETTENTSRSYELQRKTMDYVCLTLPGPSALLLRPDSLLLFIRRRANALPKAPELCLSTKSKLRLRGDDSPPVGLGNRAPLVPAGVAGFTTGVGVPTVTGTPLVPNGKYGESGG